MDDTTGGLPPPRKGRGGARPGAGRPRKAAPALATEPIPQIPEATRSAAADMGRITASIEEIAYVIARRVIAALPPAERGELMGDVGELLRRVRDLDGRASSIQTGVDAAVQGIAAANDALAAVRAWQDETSALEAARHAEVMGAIGAVGAAVGDVVETSAVAVGLAERTAQAAEDTRSLAAAAAPEIREIRATALLQAAHAGEVREAVIAAGAEIIEENKRANAAGDARVGRLEARLHDILGTVPLDEVAEAARAGAHKGAQEGVAKALPPRPVMPPRPRPFPLTPQRKAH